METAKERTIRLTNLYLEQISKKYEPDVRIVEKNDSVLMKIVAVLIFFFNKTFMTNYITVIGKTIYVPKGYVNNNSFTISVIATMAHETIHLKQKKKYGFLFYLKYLFPQITFVFVAPILLTALIISGVSLWWLLISLVCLLPLPAPWRYRFELEAYKDANMLLNKYVYNYDFNKEGVYQYHVKPIVEQMTGPAYYFTMPFKNKVKKDLLSNKEFEKETLNENNIEILEFFNRNKITLSKKF